MGTELLERQSQLDSLAWSWDEAVRGEGRLVFLAGEAGAGKTSLVRAFHDYVPSGARVLAGACEPLATPTPLGPLLDMAAELPVDLTELLRGDPVAIRHTFLGIIDSVGAGTLVTIDDAHWADEATLDLIRHVARRLEGKRALVVVTYRDDEVGSRHPLRVLMGDLATLPWVRRLSVGPLSRAAVATLAAGSAMDPDTLHDRTAGNPFFVTEVLAAGAAVVPASVRDAVLARLARLSPDVQEVVDATACLGRRVPAQLVEEVTGLPSEAVDDALASGVLLLQDGELALTHELAREAVAQAVPASKASRYHAAALRVLAGPPGHTVEPACMAEHAEKAGDRAALLAYTQAAAGQASQLGAHREAAAHFTKALSVAGDLPDAQRAALLEAASFELFLTHDLAGSVSAAQRARQLWRRLDDRRGEGRALYLLFHSYLSVAEWTTLVDGVLTEAIRGLEQVPPSPELAMVWQARAAHEVFRFHPADAHHAAQRAAEVAQALGDLPGEANARLWLALAEFQGGDDAAWSRVEDAARTLMAPAFGFSAPKAAWWPYYVAVTMRRFDVADRWFGEAMGFVLEIGVETVRQFLLSYRAWELLDRGLWDEAEELAARPLPDAVAGEGFRLIAMGVLGRLRVRRGEPGGLALLTEAYGYEESARSEVGWMARGRTALAEHAWLSGDHQAVADLLQPVLQEAIELGEPWWLGEVSFWLWRVGALDRPPAGMAHPYALLLAGRWQDAHDAWLDMGCPYDAARALSFSDEEAALRRALEVFDGFGARGERDDVARRLRKLGVRGIPRPQRQGAGVGRGDLTGRELEVLELMEAGLRNAEMAAKLFLSERTVEHHVAAILRKLQARSRIDAVSVARKQGLIM